MGAEGGRAAEAGRPFAQPSPWYMNGEEKGLVLLLGMERPSFWLSNNATGRMWDRVMVRGGVGACAAVVASRPFVDGLG